MSPWAFCFRRVWHTPTPQAKDHTPGQGPRHTHATHTRHAVASKPNHLLKFKQRNEHRGAEDVLVSRHIHADPRG